MEEGRATSVYQTGMASVWLGLENGEYPDGTEVMTDLCGLESYDVDRSEGFASDDGTPIAVADLLLPLSFSQSYARAAIQLAAKLGIHKAVWSVVQFDLAYDPALITRPIANEPTFIGYFPYATD